VFDESLADAVPIVLVVEVAVHEFNAALHPRVVALSSPLLMLQIASRDLHLLDLRINVVVPLGSQVVHLQLSQQLVLPRRAMVSNQMLLVLKFALARLQHFAHFLGDLWVS